MPLRAKKSNNSRKSNKEKKQKTNVIINRQE